MNNKLVCVVLLASCHPRESENEKKSEGDPNGHGAVVMGVMVDAAATIAPLSIHQPPLLTDVNGDGHDDAVVVAARAGNSHYVALDGMTGDVLWESDSISNSARVGYVTGGELLVPSDAGTLDGYDFKSTKPRWTTTLGERVTEVCEANGGQARMTLADKRSIVVALDTGAQLPATASTPACKPMRSNRTEYGTNSTGAIACETTTYTSPGKTPPPDRCRPLIGGNAETLLGMKVYSLDPIDKGYVVFGGHQPGTEYPVVGVMRNKAVVWKADVSLGNPLLSGTQAEVVNGDVLFISYTCDSMNYLTAFSLTNGERLWNVWYTGGRELRASRDTVFANDFARDSLTGYTSDTGKVRFTIAQR